MLYYRNHIPSIAQDVDQDGGELAMMIEPARECGVDLDSFDDEPNGHKDDRGSSVDLDSGQETASTG